jgi:hypothetical protein
VIVLCRESCEWTVADAEAWRTFMDTDSGRKLLTVLTDAAITKREKMSPKASPSEICYQAGEADGAAGLVEFMRSLQPAERQRSETDNEEDGETTLLP